MSSFFNLAAVDRTLATIEQLGGTVPARLAKIRTAGTLVGVAAGGWPDPRRFLAAGLADVDDAGDAVDLVAGYTRARMEQTFAAEIDQLIEGTTADAIVSDLRRGGFDELVAGLGPAFAEIRAGLDEYVRLIPAPPTVETLVDAANTDALVALAGGKRLRAWLDTYLTMVLDLTRFGGLLAGTDETALNGSLAEGAVIFLSAPGRSARVAEQLARPASSADTIGSWRWCAGSLELRSLSSVVAEIGQIAVARRPDTYEVTPKRPAAVVDATAPAAPAAAPAAPDLDDDNGFEEFSADDLDAALGLLPEG